MTRLNKVTRFLLVLFFATPSLLAAQAPASVAERDITPTLFDRPDLVQRYLDLIHEDDLAAHLYFFASDYFEGREATSRGQQMAAHYLASQHQRYGLLPAGTTGVDDPRNPEAYFQRFDLLEYRLNEMELAALKGADTLVTSHFAPGRFDGRSFLRTGDEMNRRAPIVFAGYGIADDRLGYNDYAALAEAGISPQNKWLMILADEPLASAEESLLPTPDGEISGWTRHWWQKTTAAAQHGPAAGLIVVGDLSPRDQVAFAQTVEIASEARKGVGQLSLPGGERRGRTTLPPIIFISPQTADGILAETGHTVRDLQRRINTTLSPVVFEVNGVDMHVRVEMEERLAPTENVLGFIEGSDPVLRDEIVVILAHYDHEGFRIGPDGRKIVYNGADDNGSGTIGVLKTARAFARAARDGYGPRRSVLFLHVTAEEKGLLGSAYYTDREPVFPLENTVAALNMDMIGRFDPTHPDGSENYVYIIGSYLISQDLHDVSVRANEVAGVHLELDERYNDPADPNQFFRRSDQWNFGKHGIPFIFYFTGTHEDYHQPGDEPHKIAYDRMERIVKLVFATAWQLANQDERPRVTGTGFN